MPSPVYKSNDNLDRAFASALRPLLSTISRSAPPARSARTTPREMKPLYPAAIMRGVLRSAAVTAWTAAPCFKSRRTMPWCPIDSAVLALSIVQGSLYKRHSFVPRAAALRPVAREWHDGERRTQASIQRREEPGCFQTVAEAGPLEPGRVLEGGCCETEREPAAGLLMPKDLFANERTFIHWVHMAVILVSFGSTAFAFADAGARFISPAARFRAAC